MSPRPGLRPPGLQGDAHTGLLFGTVSVILQVREATQTLSTTRCGHATKRRAALKTVPVTSRPGQRPLQEPGGTVSTRTHTRCAESTAGGREPARGPGPRRRGREGTSSLCCVRHVPSCEPRGCMVCTQAHRHVSGEPPPSPEMVSNAPVCDRRVCPCVPVPRGRHLGSAAGLTALVRSLRLLSS